MRPLVLTAATLVSAMGRGMRSDARRSAIPPVGLAAVRLR